MGETMKTFSLGTCVEMLPAMTHFVNGGDLYQYNVVSKQWAKQIRFCMHGGDYGNIIDDEHFTARKSFAINHTILLQVGNNEWVQTKEPLWTKGCIYASADGFADMTLSEIEKVLGYKVRIVRQGK